MRLESNLILVHTGLPFSIILSSYLNNLAILRTRKLRIRLKMDSFFFLLFITDFLLCCCGFLCLDFPIAWARALGKSIPLFMTLTGDCCSSTSSSFTIFKTKMKSSCAQTFFQFPLLVLVLPFLGILLSHWNHTITKSQYSF